MPSLQKLQQKELFKQVRKDKGSFSYRPTFNELVQWAKDGGETEHHPERMTMKEHFQHFLEKRQAK